jgi:hypothetical protein
MTTTNEDYRRRSLYDSPSSKAARAKPAKPGPIERLRAKHRDEKLELGKKHHAESLALTAEIHKARSKDHRLLSGAHPSDQMLGQEKKRTDGLGAVHKAARERLADRHRKEMDHAMKANPID